MKQDENLKDITRQEFKAILRLNGYSLIKFSEYLGKSKNYVWRVVLQHKHIRYRWIDELIGFIGKENYELALKKYRKRVSYMPPEPAPEPEPKKELEKIQAADKPKTKLKKHLEENKPKIPDAMAPKKKEEKPDPEKKPAKQKQTKPLVKKPTEKPKKEDISLT